MSMSLDGFIAGPGDDADHGLGVAGDCLPHWLGERAGAAELTRALEAPGVIHLHYRVIS